MRFKLDGLREQSGWSVDDVCKKCGQNRSECLCDVPTGALQPSQHRLHFRFEKRNGKPVTVVLPFALSEEAKKELLSQLKKALGSGGTVKGDELEFQGELKEKLRVQLEKKGFGFKK